MNRDELEELVRMYMYEPADEITAKALEDHIQQAYPGNYTVKVTFGGNEEDPRIRIQLHFTDSEDAVIFKLKY